MRLVALKRIERENDEGQKTFIPPGACFTATDKVTIERLKNTHAANPAKESDEARAKERNLKETVMPGRVRSMRERRAYQLAAEEMGERADAKRASKANKEIDEDAEDTTGGGANGERLDPGSNDGSDGSNTGEVQPGSGAGGGMDTTKLSQTTGVSRSGAKDGGRNSKLV